MGQPPVPEPEPEVQPPVGIVKPFPIPRPPPCPEKSPAQGHGESILNLLELVESDFSRSLADAQTDEDTAQAEYEATSQKNKMDKLQKEVDVKYKSKEVTTLKKTIAQLTSDLEG